MWRRAAQRRAFTEHLQLFVFTKTKLVSARPFEHGTYCTRQTLRVNRISPPSPAARKHLHPPRRSFATRDIPTADLRSMRAKYNKEHQHAADIRTPSSFLKLLYVKVHPDLFDNDDDDTYQNTNQESLGKLNSIVEYAKQLKKGNRTRSALTSTPPAPQLLRFYVKETQQPSLSDAAYVPMDMDDDSDDDDDDDDVVDDYEDGLSSRKGKKRKKDDDDDDGGILNIKHRAIDARFNPTNAIHADAVAGHQKNILTYIDRFIGQLLINAGVKLPEKEVLHWKKMWRASGDTDGTAGTDGSSSSRVPLSDVRFQRRKKRGKTVQEKRVHMAKEIRFTAKAFQHNDDYVMTQARYTLVEKMVEEEMLTYAPTLSLAQRIAATSALTQAVASDYGNLRCKQWSGRSLVFTAHSYLHPRSHEHFPRRDQDGYEGERREGGRGRERERERETEERRKQQEQASVVDSAFAARFEEFRMEMDGAKKDGGEEGGGESESESEGMGTGKDTNHSNNRNGDNSNGDTTVGSREGSTTGSHSAKKINTDSEKPILYIPWNFQIPELVAYVDEHINTLTGDAQAHLVPKDDDFTDFDWLEKELDAEIDNHGMGSV